MRFSIKKTTKFNSDKRSNSLISGFKVLFWRPRSRVSAGFRFDAPWHHLDATLPHVKASGRCCKGSVKDLTRNRRWAFISSSFSRGLMWRKRELRKRWWRSSSEVSRYSMPSCCETSGCVQYWLGFICLCCFDLLNCKSPLCSNQRLSASKPCSTLC